MPKRNSDENSDEYIRRKMRKIEKELRKRKKRSRRLSSSSSGSSTNYALPVPSITEDGQMVSPTELHGLPAEGVDLEIVEPIAGPSTEASVEPEDCPLDDDILEMLGASPSKSKKMGENIQKDIALRWEHVATSGLAKNTKKELLDKHLVPANCSKLSAPILNLEIKAAISEHMINNDKSAEYKQNQVASAISCIGEALTKIINSEHKDSSIIKPLLDGAQLLCELQFCESMKRRALIYASIKKEIKSQLYETEIDTFLFGEKLADALKTAKAISKSGSEIKVSRPKTAMARPQPRALNSKPQLANSRYPARRGQEPAAYAQTPGAFPPHVPLQRRQYMVPPPSPPPPPPPPPAPQPLPQQPQQRFRQQRPYQRR